MLTCSTPCEEVARVQHPYSCLRCPRRPEVANKDKNKGTYGVLTSAIIKVYSPIPIASTSISFSTTARGSLPATSPAAFWRGIRTYFAFVPGMCDDGGQGYNFIRPVPVFDGSAATVNVSRNLTFTTGISYPAMSAADATTRVAALVTGLRAAGVNINMPLVSVSGGPRPNGTTPPPAFPARPPGELVEQQRMATRLFPRENLADPALLNRTNDAIQTYVEEGGYVFHGINYSPTSERAGWPGSDSGVNPAFRRTVMHGEGWEGPESTTPPLENMVANHARFRRYFQGFIDVSPGAGSYINEADAGEPEWQHAFYGDKYERLVGIKRARDPWSLFLAAVSPGMDEWEVRKPEQYRDLPTQNGRLCRIETS